MPCPCGSGKKYKKCCRSNDLGLTDAKNNAVIAPLKPKQAQDMIPLHQMMLQGQTPFKQAKFVVKANGEYKSLFMFTIGKDGSLIFNAGGYFLESNWRWGFFDVPPGRVGKVDVSMIKETTTRRIEGHGPKITYHLSGWMTTKLEGHIVDDEIPRIQATPLEEVSGHIFTMMIKGFGTFKQANPSSKKYTHVIVSPDKELQSIKVVGYFGKLEDLIENISVSAAEVPHVKMIVEQFEDYTTQVEFFRIIFDSGEERWLKLQFWPNFPYNQGNDAPSFSMLTGWKQELIWDETKEVRCLGLLAGK
jgi:hypothetical protein